MFYDTSGLVNGATRQKLTQAAMREMKIPYREIDEQQEIVGKIDSVFSLIEKSQLELRRLDELVKSKLAVKQSLEKLETLKKSLMQQYFG